MSTATATVALWCFARRQPVLPAFVRVRLNALATMTGVQFSLGVATLLHAVPVSLGSAHQTGALVLFSLTLWTLHGLRLPRSGAVLHRASQAVKSATRVRPTSAQTGIVSPSPVLQKRHSNTIV